jgi:putative ABC transport system permease protein
MHIWDEDSDVPRETKQIYGIGELELESFSDVDYEQLRSGNVCIVSRFTINEGSPVAIPKVGERITLVNSDGSTRDFEVIALVDEYPYQLSARYTFGDSLTVVISNEAFLDFYGPASAMQMDITVADDTIAETEELLSTYVEKTDTKASYTSRATLMADFEGLRSTYVAIGGALSLILALIGLLNFINSQVTSIFTRRRELAILQSIGLTGAQTKVMLFFEGVFHAALVMVFTVTLGAGIGYVIMQVIAGQIWFFGSKFSLMPSLYCIVPLLIICATVPLICYRWLSRESIVERLRVE